MSSASRRAIEDSRGSEPENPVPEPVDAGDDERPLGRRDALLAARRGGHRGARRGDLPAGAADQRQRARHHRARPHRLGRARRRAARARAVRRADARRAAARRRRHRGGRRDRALRRRRASRSSIAADLPDVGDTGAVGDAPARRARSGPGSAPTPRRSAGCCCWRAAAGWRCAGARLRLSSRAPERRDVPSSARRSAAQSAGDDAVDVRSVVRTSCRGPRGDPRSTPAIARSCRRRTVARRRRPSGRAQAPRWRSVERTASSRSAPRDDASPRSATTSIQSRRPDRAPPWTRYRPAARRRPRAMTIASPIASRRPVVVLRATCPSSARARRSSRRRAGAGRLRPGRQASP